MLLLNALLAPAVIAQAFTPAPRVHPTTTTPPARRADTTLAVMADTVVVRLDDAAAAVAADTAPPARVVFDFGGGRGVPIVARALEFGVSSTPATSSKGQPATAARVRFVRAPDSLSAELARRVATGERITAVDVQLEGRGGAPAVVVRLFDAQVVSTRLEMNDDNVGLLQQKLALEESIAQLSVDVQDARRQLDVAESLDKRHMSSSMELARARGSADALAARLAVQRERLALVSRQLARWTPVQEEVVLTATRTSLDTR